METINKTTDLVLPYTYLLKFSIKNKILYYYGVRYGNVKLNLSPSQDLFKYYFTSSKVVRKLLSDGIYPIQIVIHKIFENHNCACEYEIKFLTRINARDRFDFLNAVNHWDNSKAYSNRGRQRTNEEKQHISIMSTIIQSDAEYKKRHSEKMKSKWNDPEYKRYMEEKNNAFWTSERSINIRNKRKTQNNGTKHTDETKQLMSEKAKEYCKTINCSERARKRRKYDCPECSMKNIDSSNFERHMKTHNWEIEKSKIFKKLKMN